MRPSVPTSTCISGCCTSAAILLACLGAIASGQQARNATREMSGFAPDQNALPTPPPGDAVVLFDGEDCENFVAMSGETLNWTIRDGGLVSTANGRRSNHAVSRWHFCDAEIHVEFQLPHRSDGNSGVYVQGLYELQILDSSGRLELSDGDMGAVYGVAPPLTNASLPPGKWQVVDIQFRAPRRDEQAAIVEEGSFTAWLNGRLVQQETRLGEPKSKFNPYRYDTTPYLQDVHDQWRKTNAGPLVLQDHDAEVRFRNVWVRPLDGRASLFTLTTQPQSSSDTAD